MSENNEGVTVTTNALVKKRADLLFEIGQREREIERLQTELVHVDAVLRMFRPDFQAEALPVRHRRPTKSPYFRHGELTQRIYDALRQHGLQPHLGIDLARDWRRHLPANPNHVAGHDDELV